MLWHVDTEEDNNSSWIGTESLSKRRHKEERLEEKSLRGNPTEENESLRSTMR